MTPLRAIALLLLAASTASAAPAQDVAVQFLGWSPDGVRYAFVRHRTAHLDDGRTQRSERTFLREVDEDLTERTLPMSDEEVRAAVADEGFVVAPLARRPAGELAWVFIDEDGIDRLRFTVIVGEGLSWELATRGPDGVRRTLATRPLDALYVDFEPDVYVAPGGGRALLVVGMRAPFRYGADLVLVPVGGGPMPMARAVPAPPTLPAAGAAAAAEEPVVAPGDVVVDWTQTDMVIPVVQEPLPVDLTPRMAGDEGAATAPSTAPSDAPGAAPSATPSAAPSATPPTAEVAAEELTPTASAAEPASPLDLPPVAREPTIGAPFREAEEPPSEEELPEVQPQPNEGGRPADAETSLASAAAAPVATTSSATGAKPPKADAEPPKADAKPPKVDAKPPKADAKPPKVDAKPPKADAKPAKVDAKPPKADAKPAKVDAKPPKADAKPAKVDAKPPKADAKPPEADVKTPAASPPSTGAGSGGTVRLLGLVKAREIYDGKPIAGARVTLSTGQVVKTNRSGLYEVRVSPGLVTVTATAKGYEPWTEVKEVEPGVDNWRSLALVRRGQARPEPPPVPPTPAP